MKRILFLCAYAALLVCFFPETIYYSLQQTNIQIPSVTTSQAPDLRPALIALLQVKKKLEKAPPLPDFFSEEKKGKETKQEGCTFSAEQVDAILTAYNSPAVGLGAFSVSECKRTGIDNAVWLAQFLYESGGGSNPNWAGRKPDGTTTGNTGNIICAGFPTCYGRFRDYNGDWQAGTRQHFDLLRCYRDGGGDGCGGLWEGKAHQTPDGELDLEAALQTYAPPSDNNTAAYVEWVRDFAEVQKVAEEAVTLGELTPEETFIGEGNETVVRSNGIPLGGFGPYSAECVRQNILGSVLASPGLQTIRITPGEEWSFIENWTVDPDALSTCGLGVKGAGVCDLAADIISALDKLGVQRSFHHHNIKLTLVSWEQSIAIWGTPGVRGEQDLIVLSDRPIELKAVITDDELYFKGGFDGRLREVRYWFP